MPLSPEEVDRVVEEFERIRPQYKRFALRMADLLATLVEEIDVKFESVNHRTKSVGGFREKITRPGKAYSDPLAQITDLAGLRIVLFYDEDVKRVTDMLRRELAVDETLSVDKIQSSEPDRFGYSSVHLVAGLREDRKQLKEWARLSTLRAEIQVRTVLQHAWAAVSHELNYKQDEAPVAWSRRLHRLAGVFELADEQFSILRRERKEARADVADALQAGNLAIAVSELSLREYLRSSESVASAWRAAESHMFIRQERPAAEDFTVELARLADRAGLRTVADVEGLLSGQLPSAEQFFRRLTDNDSHHWWANEAFVVALLILLGKRGQFSEDDLVAEGWTREVAQKIVKALSESAG